MRSFKRERGFLTFAQNGPSGDYLRMAYTLALSLRATQKTENNLSVVITPGQHVPDRYKEVFDEIIDVPWLDEAKHQDWKLGNEWKAYHCTPYRQTVKLDADMLFLSDMSAWWPSMARNDVLATTQVFTYRNEKITSRYCRKTFDANSLPDIYTAFMFYQYSDLAEELFKMAEIIFHNWERFSYDFMDETRPSYPSTDVVFALAMKLTDTSHLCSSDDDRPAFIHMKPQLQNFPRDMVSEQWTKHIPVTLSSNLELKIGRHRQFLPFHYTDKSFPTDEIVRTYEKVIGL